MAPLPKQASSVEWLEQQMIEDIRRIRNIVFDAVDHAVGAIEFDASMGANDAADQYYASMGMLSNVLELIGTVASAIPLPQAKFIVAAKYLKYLPQIGGAISATGYGVALHAGAQQNAQNDSAKADPAKGILAEVKTRIHQGLNHVRDTLDYDIQNIFPTIATLYRNFRNDKYFGPALTGNSSNSQVVWHKRRLELIWRTQFRGITPGNARNEIEGRVTAAINDLFKTIIQFYKGSAGVVQNQIENLPHRHVQDRRFGRAGVEYKVDVDTGPDPKAVAAAEKQLEGADFVARFKRSHSYASWKQRHHVSELYLQQCI